MSDIHLWQLEKVAKARKTAPEPMEIDTESREKDVNEDKKAQEYANLVKL